MSNERGINPPGSASDKPGAKDGSAALRYMTVLLPSVGKGNANTPKAGIFDNLQADLPAGLVVFLVALPLCLGVALASGAPLFSGIIAGFVGGIVVTLFSGSQLSVSGPAAGLAVIVLESIAELGGDFQVFQVALLIAGVLQIGLGILKAGTISHYFPSSVINGMLAAIGISIILKQFPHAVGYHAGHLAGNFRFESGEHNTFSAIASAFSSISFGAVVISLISALVLLWWNKLSIKALKSIPAPLIVVILGVLVNELHHLAIPALQLSGKFLVTLPITHSPGEFLAQFSLPSFGHIGEPEVLRIAVTIAIIASLETLLSLEAVDKIDPQRRRSNGNTELRAQGIGNAISGMIGGLPITSVIVRSSVNVNAGGRTKVAALTHGVLLLVAVMLVPQILDMIPLASLATILLVTGFKLANVGLFKSMFKAGWSQFIPFMVTIIAVQFSDLLEGIAIGMVVGIVFLLWDHYQTSHSFEVETDLQTRRLRIVLAEHVSFLNKARLAKTLHALPEAAVVEIDGSRSRSIDQDVLVLIHNFAKDTAREKRIRIQLTDIPEPKASGAAH
jgi:MFS superfamily sulfate permease-like transporter